MKNLFLIFIALLLSQNSSAQEKVLELSMNRLDNNSIDFSYEKNKPGSYTVVLKFINLTNSFQPKESVVSVDGNRGVLMTLRPNNKDQSIKFDRYSFRYILGALNPKINENFCYILPYNFGKNLKVEELGYINETYFGSGERSDWKSYSLSTNQQDTVIAIRKGVVVDIEDIYEDKNLENILYTSEKNRIIVEHEDGTLLRYLGFKGGSINVKLGDTVLPGSVLGLNSLTRNSNYAIRLLLYYLNSSDFQISDSETLAKPVSMYKILTPKFTLDGTNCVLLENRNEYTVYNSEEIITRELSKKELKKYMSSKQKK